MFFHPNFINLSTLKPTAMTHKTKVIILRSIKYGETSLVVTAFTELFGIQIYLVNGVRASNKKNNNAACFQPSAILSMEVYHNELKSMHRIKEYGFAHLYKNIFSNVIKNSVALFMVELLYKILKQPEHNPALFNFCEDALIHLDEAPPTVTANFPLFFTLHLSYFFGFKINEEESGEANNFIDLQEGCFTSVQPNHPHFLAGEDVTITSELLKTMLPAELNNLQLNKQKRKQLLLKYLDYYQLQHHHFGQMKTLAVLEEILSN